MAPLFCKAKKKRRKKILDWDNFCSGLTKFESFEKLGPDEVKIIIFPVETKEQFAKKIPITYHYCFKNVSWIKKPILLPVLAANPHVSFV